MEADINIFRIINDITVTRAGYDRGIYRRYYQFGRGVFGLVVQSVFVFLFLFSFSSRVIALPIMGPGTELRIKNLIGLNAGLYPLADGWNIAEYQYTDFDIFVSLEKPPGGKAVFRLACTSLPSKNRLIGESRNFRIELSSFSGVSEEEAVLAGRALRERIKHNETPLFFDQPDMQNREGIYELLFRKYLFIPFIIAGIASGVALIIVLFPAIKKHLLATGATGAICLALLVAAGLFLRFAVGPEAPVHNNGHGIRELRAVLYMESPEPKEILYGRVYITLMSSLAGVAGNTDGSVFVINQIFGALAVLGMFMLARALRFSDIAALTAAAAFCFSPGLVWLSSSESPVSMHLFFVLAGFAFAAVSAQLRSKPFLWLSCIFICFGSTMRLTTMSAAPVAVLIFAYSSLKTTGSGSEKDAGFRKHLIACSGLLITWLLFHFLSLDPDNVGNGIARISPSVYLHTMRKYNILFDSTLSPACLPYFALAAFVPALWKKPYLAALVAVVFVIVVPVSFTTMADRTDFLRYQPQTHWIYFLLTGVLVDFIRKSFLPRRIAVFAAVCIPIALVLFSITGLRFLATGNEEIAEYHFIKDMSLELRPGSRISLPVRPAAGQRMISEFPDYMGEYKLNKKEIIGNDSDEIIYIGLDCYRYDDIGEKGPESAGPGIRKECVTICAGNPVVMREKELNAEIPDGSFHKRYFMLSTKHPVIGFYKCPENQIN
ncbi:MAG TPA: hypothetical protein PLN69_09385 [bacterium]|nr:hypothetical protein [bacterium]